MSTDKVYIINDGKSITSGGKIHKPGKEVTPDSMGLSNNQFSALLVAPKGKKPGIIDNTAVKSAAEKAAAAEKKAAEDLVKEAQEKAAKEAKELAEKNTFDPELVKANRMKLIGDTIDSLFDADGKPHSDKDFTKKGIPKVDALEALLKESEGFKDGITDDERDEAWKSHKYNK